MVTPSILSEFELGDTVARYLQDAPGKCPGLLLFPVAKRNTLVAPRASLADEPEIAGLPWKQAWPARHMESLVQVKCLGDDWPGAFTQGRSMLNSGTVQQLSYDTQTVQREASGVVVTTLLRGANGLACEHRLAWRTGTPWLEVTTMVRNEGERELTLELLSSFALGGITPFAAGDAPERLWVHRFRSAWSAEGRHERQLMEQLHLERSWIGHAVRSERFGQVGSIPTNGFFPRVAVEDAVAGVVWGAQLAWPGSWQLEVYRRDDGVNLCGGLADRELGHWMKMLPPGQSFSAPPATVAVCAGTIDDVCDRLTAAQVPAVETQPSGEADLPVICNEWCTSWGKPTHDSLVTLARRLKGTGTRYLVIDAGWYGDGEIWSNSQGEWEPSQTAFPKGLKVTADAIRAEGLIPGLWFEFEVCGAGSRLFGETKHFLHRDGVPITVSGRRFWDFRDPWVHEYLSQRVIGLLDQCGFGYLKVDYNENIGLGVDGAESLGEGLRQHLADVQQFFRTIRQRLPNLVIENCSSGGHRLEPSMLALASMASFSDAHETLEIPIIAANLHRLILPRQTQIFAVLRASDSLQRLVYTLTAGLLGRLCLSGDLNQLNDEQWMLMRRAVEFYGRAAPIIRTGTSRRFGPEAMSYRHPRGWQAVVRTSADGHRALIVAHTFAGPSPSPLAIPLPSGRAWRVTETLHADGTPPSVLGNSMSCPMTGEFRGVAVLLEN